MHVKKLRSLFFFIVGTTGSHRGVYSSGLTVTCALKSSLWLPATEVALKALSFTERRWSWWREKNRIGAQTLERMGEGKLAQRKSKLY